MAFIIYFVSDKIWTCERCNKSYRYKQNLFRHMKHECGDRRDYCCEFCNKRFRQKYAMETHQAIAHGFGKKRPKYQKRNIFEWDHL